MSINIARDYRIWIAKPGQTEANALELTRYCSGDSGGFLTVSVPPLDESGLIRVTGQLVLAVPQAPDGFNPTLDFSPWENPSQWAPGNRLLVKVSDQAGTLRRLPFSQLYLLSEPEQPHPGNWTLTLELGDRFTLLDSVKPRPVAMGAAVSATPSPVRSFSGSRGMAINWLLSGATDLTYSGGLPGPSLTDYEADLDSPLVGQIGELALGGFGSLYLDRDDQIKTVWLGTAPERRLFKHVVGRDCAADWQPLQNPIRPATRVEVISPESAVELSQEEIDRQDGGLSDPRQNPDWDEAENSDAQKYGGSKRTVGKLSRGTIDGSDDTEEIDAIFRRETWSWGGNRYQSHVDESRARGLVIGEDLYELLEQQGRNIFRPSPFVRIGALIEQEERIYEGGSEGRLLRVTKTLARPKGEVWAEYYKRNLRPEDTLPDFGGMVVAEVETTRYRYQTASGKDSKGQVREIRYWRYTTMAELAGPANDWNAPGQVVFGLSALKVAEAKTQRWTKRSADEWEYQIQHYRAGQARSGPISAYLALKLVDGQTVSSRNGDIQPPAADRRPSTDRARRKRRMSYLTRGRVEVEDNDAPRERQVIINHLPSAADAVELAEILAKLDAMRSKGYRITTTLRDEWFSWWPLARVDLQLGDQVWWGATDALTLTLAADQALVVADFLRVGRSPDADPYPYPPLPPLLPSKPDPTPLVGSPYPDRSNSQPLIPVVVIRRPFEVRSRVRVQFRAFDYPLGLLPTSSLTVQSVARVQFLQQLQVRSRSRTILEEIPLLTVRSRSQVVISDPTPPTPFAFWPLDASPWTDEAGDRDLSAVEVPPLIGSESGEGYSEFNWPSEFGQQFGTLETADLQWTRTATANYSWRIEFQVWWPSGAFAGGHDFVLGIANEVRLIVRNTLLYVDLNNASFPLELTLAGLAEQTWHAVTAEYDAATQTLSGSVNDQSGSRFVPDVPQDVAPSPFQIGRAGFLFESFANVRVKNVEFTPLALVER